MTQDEDILLVTTRTNSLVADPLERHTEKNLNSVNKMGVIRGRR